MAQIFGFQQPNRNRSNFPSPDVVFFEDFIGSYFAKDDELTNESDPCGQFSEVANRGAWLVTQETKGEIECVVPQDDADGGWIKVISDTDDGDQVCCQLNGEPFKLEAGRQMSFECRLDFASVADHAMVGLAVNTTDPITTAPSDYIAFSIDGDADLLFVADTGSAGTTPVDTGEDVAEGTFVTVGFEWDAVGQLVVYVDGSVITSTTTTIPEDKFLSPFIAVESNGTTAGEVIVDYISITNERG
jgi:hypothetical protein